MRQRRKEVICFRCSQFYRTLWQAKKKNKQWTWIPLTCQVSWCPLHKVEKEKVFQVQVHIGWTKVRVKVKQHLVPIYSHCNNLQAIVCDWPACDEDLSHRLPPLLHPSRQAKVDSTSCTNLLCSRGMCVRPRLPCLSPCLLGVGILPVCLLQARRRLLELGNCSNSRISNPTNTASSSSCTSTSAKTCYSSRLWLWNTGRGRSKVGWWCLLFWCRLPFWSAKVLWMGILPTRRWRMFFKSGLHWWSSCLFWVGILPVCLLPTRRRNSSSDTSLEWQTEKNDKTLFVVIK